MTQKQAAVTVTDASGVKDLVVPLGTTVTGLLSMLDIDSSDPSLQITGVPLILAQSWGLTFPRESSSPLPLAASASVKNNAQLSELPTPGSALPLL